MTQRRGARSRAEIPKKVLADLNQGKIEAKTLAESLAIDFQTLLAATIPKAKKYADRLSPSLGIVARMTEGGKIVIEALGEDGIAHCIGHPSDTVRGWGAFAIGLLPGLSVPERLARIRPLADDANSGVREWAWLGVRSAIAGDLKRAIKTLVPWTKNPSDRIRRFATESTRPRGVWCSHLTLLKESPGLGLPLLEPLRADESKYVQDSVSNWLNDAAKSQPDWVRDICKGWLAQSDAPSTRRICNRATRSISH